MYRHARQGPARADLFPGVAGVVDVAVDVDRDSRRAGDIDGLGGSLLGAQPPANTAPAPAEPDQAIDAVGTSGGRMAST